MDLSAIRLEDGACQDCRIHASMCIVLRETNEAVVAMTDEAKQLIGEMQATRATFTDHAAAHAHDEKRKDRGVQWGQIIAQAVTAIVTASLTAWGAFQAVAHATAK